MAGGKLLPYVLCSTPVYPEPAEGPPGMRASQARRRFTGEGACATLWEPPPGDSSC